MQQLDNNDPFYTKIVAGDRFTFKFKGGNKTNTQIDSFVLGLRTKPFLFLLFSVNNSGSKASWQKAEQEEREEVAR